MSQGIPGATLILISTSWRTRISDLVPPEAKAPDYTVFMCIWINAPCLEMKILHLHLVLL